jgi:hypothetical protein
MRLKIRILVYLVLVCVTLLPFAGWSRQVKNVPAAFEAINSEPEVLFLSNDIAVPTKSGHMQGVQLLEEGGKQKLLMSGSSLVQAYILQADLASRKTEKLFPLMKDPYRHAGGFQATDKYLVVGIEDNIKRTTSKVNLYQLPNDELANDSPSVVIEREGLPELKTSGAAGILEQQEGYLVVVSNWDSRNWDFYRINPGKVNKEIIITFAAPKDWGGYQSINLLSDAEAIYAIGFYKDGDSHKADLILVSQAGAFQPIMRKVLTRSFNCNSGVSFGAAAGLQVDKAGNLHIWATQPAAAEKIAVNHFFQR